MLEVGDEYPEEDRPVERVREDDWSLMADSRRFEGRSLLHRRHFQFVLPFMEEAVAGCTPELIELARPVELNIRSSVSAGASSYLGRAGLFVGAGVGLGLPIGRQREWEAFLEGRFSMVSGLEDEARSALLLGARLGLDYRLNPGSGGPSFGGFGELGYGWFQTDIPSSREGGTPSRADRESGYGEVGLTAGWTFEASGILSGGFGLEAAYGRSFDQINLDDTTNAEWFRAGLTASFEFWAL